MKTWLTYILCCADDSLYTGITNDLKNRLAMHKAGKASKYTRSRLPVKVVWKEKMKDESAARKREIEIKKLTKAQKERLIS